MYPEKNSTGTGKEVCDMTIWKRSVSLFLALLLCVTLCPVAHAAEQQLNATGGNPVGDPVDLMGYCTYNDDLSASFIHYSITAQALDNGYCRLTHSFNTVAGLSIYVFDSPDGETFGYWGSLTSNGKNTVVADIPVHLLEKVSLLVINHHLSDTNRYFVHLRTADILANLPDAEAITFAGGSGTKSNPYQIATISQLELLNTMDTSGVYFVQTANLTRTATSNWTPIADFSGHYDGKGHTISGININGTNSQIGLFGSVTESGVVQNVHLINSTIKGWSSVGGIVGYNKGTIANCSNRATVIGFTCAGGVIGYQDHGVVENCSNSGDISITKLADTQSDKPAAVGGVVGFHIRSDSTVRNCTNYGTVSVQNLPSTLVSYIYAGGVVGLTEGATVEDCTNYGEVSGAIASGGITGLFASGTDITNCSNTGSITGTTEAGGIVGYSYSSSSITGCTNSGTITGLYAGGIASYNQDAAIANCINSGKVSGSKWAGGVTSAMGGADITNCVNSGTISGNNNVGGISGCHDQGTAKNCLNTGTVSGSYNIGGISGYHSNGTMTNCANYGSISGSKDINATIGYLDNSTVTNCYYLNTSCGGGRGVSKTAAQFKSGEVAYLLGDAWGQNIDNGQTRQDYPVPGGAKVYSLGNGVYSNDGHVHTPETQPAKAATCTETGLTEGTICATCGAVLVAQTVTPATGHTEVPIPGTAASCTGTGLTEGTRCSVCNEILVYPETIPALNHKDTNNDLTCDTCGISIIWDGTEASSFAGGSGTEDDPYQIANGAQLARLNSIDTTGKYFIQVANIRLNDVSKRNST